MSPTHAVTVDGQILTKRYVTWFRDEPAREWAALHLVSRHAPDLVPVPLDRTWADGGVSTTGIARPAVSMTVVPGVPLSGSLSAPQLDALADALEALWSIPPDGLLPIDLPALVDRVHVGLSTLRRVPGVIGTAAREWLETGYQLTDVPDPVVAHGDPNLENYLWDGGRVRIVDFEDAGRGDLAVELANLVEHLSGRSTDWSGFTDRFAVDPDRFHTARCLWAGFWLTLVGPGGPSAARNPPGTAEAQAGRVLTLLRPGSAAAPGGRRPRGC
ncbi:aminoglycoside phosphotransferase family protein [Kribbella turkmenica]|uniref:Aminoglycoside phosphotransferase family protein n=1 Tax=Kribbella turkmenica TaxID=2530375 RepID=A0A4R4X159_9ACTN|nr:aminoglycoside phosphotransferase family protein [Kribbella turkmenica]TDD23938.1 aminoglycoside phosphotransferase family protein [Kribbella turkmenica]